MVEHVKQHVYAEDMKQHVSEVQGTWDGTHCHIDLQSLW